MQRRNNQSIYLICALFLALGLMAVHPVAGSAPKQEGYPPPGEVTVEAPPFEDAPLQPTALPYPPAGTGFDGATPIPIGSQGVNEATGGDSAASILNAQQDGNRGLIFLWLGFFATLLIFLTSVVGAIVLFTRRNET